MGDFSSSTPRFDDTRRLTIPENFDTSHHVVHVWWHPRENITMIIPLVLVLNPHSCSVRIFHHGHVPTIFPWHSRYVPITKEIYEPQWVALGSAWNVQTTRCPHATPLRCDSTSHWGPVPCRWSGRVCHTWHFLHIITAWANRGVSESAWMGTGISSVVSKWWKWLAT